MTDPGLPSAYRHLILKQVCRFLFFCLFFWKTAFGKDGLAGVKCILSGGREGLKAASRSKSLRTHQSTWGGPSLQMGKHQCSCYQADKHGRMCSGCSIVSLCPRHPGCGRMQPVGCSPGTYVVKCIEAESMSEHCLLPFASLKQIVLQPGLLPTTFYLLHWERLSLDGEEKEASSFQKAVLCTCSERFVPCREHKIFQ